MRREIAFDAENELRQRIGPGAERLAPSGASQLV